MALWWNSAINELSESLSERELRTPSKLAGFNAENDTPLTSTFRGQRCVY